MDQLKKAYEEHDILCKRVKSGTYTSFDLDMLDLIHTWITAAENALRISKTNISAPVLKTEQDGTHHGKPN
jgi:hypothetical protein